MKSVLKHLEERFRSAFQALDIPDNVAISLSQSSKSEFGDYQVNGVMAGAKALGLNPRALAEQIINQVNVTNLISEMTVAGPGFINIRLDNKYLADTLLLMNSDNHYGVKLAESEQQTVVVDLSGPNLAKEMHVGHLRSTVIGDAIARINEYLGHKVIRQNHVGDWGTQFGMLIAYLTTEIKAGNFTHTIGDLEDFYRRAKVKFDEDAEFAARAREYVVVLQNWQDKGEAGNEVYKYWKLFRDISLTHCQEVYDRLQVCLTFDDVAGESFFNQYLADTVLSLENSGLVATSNGAKCIFFAKDELPGGEDTPMIIEKQDGGFLYATTDLAALNYRVHTLLADRVIYVVDNRQAFHFKQLFIVARKATFANPNTELHHSAFGTMMNEDGRPFKTRSGGTVKLIDMIDEAIKRAEVIVRERNSDWSEDKQQELANTLAVAAIKYADLSKNRNSDYIFSFDKMLAFDGNTAPYLLYAYTRIQSVLARANEVQLVALQATKILINASEERALILHLVKFPDMLQLAALEDYPHYVCHYLYVLAGLFMRFYEECSILKADSQDIIASRLVLVAKTAQVLKVGLDDLLGIPVVSKM